MELNITERKDNASLSRTEVQATISFEKAMPPRKEIREALCSALGSDPSCVVVISAMGSFGTKQAEVRANVYKTAQAAAIEGKHLRVRDALIAKEDKKKAAKKAPAKK